MINYKRFALRSIEFIYEYIKLNRLQSLVLGISGGIDSTVVACLANIACKSAEIPLIGRSLPTYTNDTEEIKAARLVGAAFCSDFKEVAIEKMFAEIADEISLYEGKMNGLQLGNIKARLRMIYLYNLASIHRGCVLDTDNKTEHELGFWTIHGDVGDLNCGLIHLWKTEVYELADYLANTPGNGISEEQKQAIKASIKLIPTDGNGVKAGGDCAQFGLDNYEQVDDVLKTMYFDRDAAWDCPNEKGDCEYIRLIDSYNEQGVDKVMMLHQNSEFKREHLPIYPSVDILYDIK